MTTVPPAFVLFWLDLMQCNLNFLHLLQNFQQTTWFSLKKPWSPKTPERRCNSIVSCEKTENIRKNPERVMSTKSFPYILCAWKGRWEVPVFWQHMLYPQQSNTLILILKQIGRSAKKKKKNGKHNLTFNLLHPHLIQLNLNPRGMARWPPNPLTFKFFLVILLTVCYTILLMLLLRIWYCIN